jgi:hypothetical protein
MTTGAGVTTGAGAAVMIGAGAAVTTGAGGGGDGVSGGCVAAGGSATGGGVAAGVSTTGGAWRRGRVVGGRGRVGSGTTMITVGGAERQSGVGGGVTIGNVVVVAGTVDLYEGLTIRLVSCGPVNGGSSCPPSEQATRRMRSMGISFTLRVHKSNLAIQWPKTKTQRLGIPTPNARECRRACSFRTDRGGHWIVPWRSVMGAMDTRRARFDGHATPRASAAMR